jgi:hypothetical protein
MNTLCGAANPPDPSPYLIVTARSSTTKFFQILVLGARTFMKEGCYGSRADSKHAVSSFVMPHIASLAHASLAYANREDMMDARDTYEGHNHRFLSTADTIVWT